MSKVITIEVLDNGLVVRSPSSSRVAHSVEKGILFVLEDIGLSQADKIKLSKVLLKLIGESYGKAEEEKVSV